MIVNARVLEAYEEFLVKFVEQFNISLNPNLFSNPIVQTAVFGQLDPQFIDYMAPGIMITIIFILSIGLTAIIFIIEKKDGLMERNAAANVNTLELIIAHMTMKFIVMFFQTLVLLVITTLVFDVNMQGSKCLCLLFMFQTDLNT